MGPNATAFLIGVLVAVASFLVKEISSDMIRAIRFRRRLVEDIKTIIEGHKGHYPELQRLRDAVSKNAPSFIWDSALSGIGNFSENSHHLKSLESAQCSRFYDELSRISEIRAEYNLAVRNIVAEEAKRDLYTAIAAACLGDLQRYYQQVIKRGCKCLLELKKNHWFLAIDEVQCQEELNKDSK
jgi:hypothetical protein